MHRINFESNFIKKNILIYFNFNQIFKFFLILFSPKLLYILIGLFLIILLNSKLLFCRTNNVHILLMMQCMLFCLICQYVLIAAKTFHRTINKIVDKKNICSCLIQSPTHSRQRIVLTCLN